MKVIHRHETDRTLDRLPDLPPDVRVPDDISGLEPPTTRPAAKGVRWMRWLAAFVLIGGAGVVTAVLVTGDDTVQAPVVAPATAEAPSGFDSPGGNSLNIPPRPQAPSGFDSPGGNSLNIPPRN